VDLSSSICLDLLSPDVNSMPCELTENCIQDFLRQNYPQHLQIYTDGSRSATGSVSAGLYQPSTNLATGWLLNPVHTILGAELFAILKAMQLATTDESLQDKPVLILTDSRAALQILSSLSGGSYRSIVVQIHKLMQIKGLDRVMMCWVRGHSNICGNEVADRMANLAHTNDRSARSSLCFEEWLCLLKINFLKHWSLWWSGEVQSSGKGTFRLGLGATVNYVDYGSLPRSIECAVARLRLGHAGVKAHLARFNLANSSICPTCNTEDTIAHFILYCSLFINQRREFRSSLENLLLPWNFITALGGGDIPQKRRTAVLRRLGQYLQRCSMVNTL
jgi:ribonuclease HI